LFNYSFLKVFDPCIFWSAENFKIKISRKKWNSLKTKKKMKTNSEKDLKNRIPIKKSLGDRTTFRGYFQRMVGF
jgi:hypothetical protein